MDYFTKRVEAKPLANIMDVDLEKHCHTVRAPSPSSQTMAFNLIANLSEDTVVTWELRIDILPQLIPKGMDKLRLLTRS